MHSPNGSIKSSMGGGQRESSDTSGSTVHSYEVRVWDLHQF